MFNVLIPFSSHVVRGGRGVGVGGVSLYLGSGLSFIYPPPLPEHIAVQYFFFHLVGQLTTPSLPHHLYKRIRKNLGSQNISLELLAAVTLFVKDAFILPIFLLL